MKIRGTALGLFSILLATQVSAQPAAPAKPDPVRAMVKRLDLEKYKATIKGLTQFGDRRQGTQRNRDAINWIEAQLKSYGCTNTERLKYTFGVEPPHAVAPPPADRPGSSLTGATGAAAGATRCAGSSPKVYFSLSVLVQP